jgi:hypothetical protein
MKGDELIFSKLLKAGAKVDQRTFHYFCNFFCSNNCPSLIKEILEKSTDVDINGSCSINEEKPLHRAVINAKEDKLQGLKGSLLMVLSKKKKKTKKRNTEKFSEILFLFFFWTCSRNCC